MIKFKVYFIYVWYIYRLVSIQYLIYILPAYLSKSIAFERSVDFKMYFWCHPFDQNRNKNTVRISVLNFFVAFWGLPGSLFRLPGDFVSM